MLYLAAVLAIFATACKKEKIDPTKPSISWDTNASFSQVELTNSLDAVVKVLAPGKIQDVKLVLDLGAFNILANQYIKLEPNKSKSGSNPVLDLIGDDSSVNLLGGLGMRVGASLRGQENLQLDLKKILNRILLNQPVENNTSFSIEVRVTDQASNTASKTAKFHFTAAPTFTWEKNPFFDEVDLDAAAVDCKVEVWAPGKIEKLTVTLSGSAAPYLKTYILNRTSGQATASGDVTIDLVGDEKVADSFKGWFPSGKEVSDKDQAILDFGFLYNTKYDMEPSVNPFTITAVDKNEKETVVQVSFRKN